MRYRIPALILLAALCTGCPRPLWLPNRNLKSRVERSEVVGKWVLTTNSLGLLTRDGFNANEHSVYMIEFRTDGTLAYQSVLAGFHTGTYQNVQGTWVLQHGTKAHSNIRSKNAIDMTLKTSGGTHSRGLLFDKDKHGIILWEYYGDPDSWEFMEYRKAEPGGSPYSSPAAGSESGDR